MPAISALESPRAASAKISRSRSVRSPYAGGTGRGAASAKCANSSRVADAAITADPECTVRIAASRNSGSASLSRNPLAPCRIARAAASSRSKVVSITTRGGSASRSSSAVASRPSITGIRMSIEHDVGAGVARRRRAPRDRRMPPPTTSRSGCESISMRMPARNSAWSSTSTTRIGARWTASRALTVQPRRDGQRRRHDELAVLAGGLQPPAGEGWRARPCRSARGPSPPAARRLAPLRTSSVAPESAMPGESAPHRLSVAVAKGVRERLLQNAVHGELHGGAAVRADGAGSTSTRSSTPAARTWA